MSAEDHLRRWLAQGMTGCQFAAKDRARHQRIIVVALGESADAADVSAILETGREAKLPAIAMFTGIRSEESLVQQLVRLSEGNRWRISEVFSENSDSDDCFVGLDWTVRDGLVSSVMGFAPLASMPVTRRAPYACMAAWPGEHDNPHWTRFEPGVVHFLDSDFLG